MPPDSTQRRGGRRADRRFPPGRCRALSRARDCWRCSRGRYPARNADAEHRRPQGAGRRLRQGRARNCTEWCGISAGRWSRPIWATCRTTPRRQVRRVLERAERRRIRLRDGRWRRSSRCASRSTVRRGAPRSTSPARARSARPTSTRPRAVCMAAVLYVFRTLVDDEIPMNGGCLEPLGHRHPAGLDAEPALSRRGGRRQCRDLAMHHRRALWRARRDGGGAGHDEQLHLRQRAPPVLRDDLRRLRRGSGFRRRRRRPHPHDQHAPDRPRGAGVALSGAGRELFDPSRLGRRAAAGMAATASSAASASASR